MRFVKSKIENLRNTLTTYSIAKKISKYKYTSRSASLKSEMGWFVKSKIKILETLSPHAQ